MVFHDYDEIDYKKDEEEFNKCINTIGKLFISLAITDFFVAGIVAYVYKDDFL